MKKGRLKKHSDSNEYFIYFVNGKEVDRPKLVPPKVFKWRKKEDEEQRKVDILKVRLTLLKLLSQIIYHQKIVDSKELQYFIKICDEYIVKYKVKSGKIEKAFELAPSSKFKEFVYFPWLRDLSFNIVGYLSDPNNDIRKIKQCELCKDIFISERVNKRTKYCPICSPKSKMSKKQRRAYQIKWRGKKKRKKDNFHRNENINRLINAGYNRKDAEAEYEETLKADKDM